VFASADELERLVEEAERHRAEDKEITKNSEARSTLENYLYRHSGRVGRAREERGASSAGGEVKEEGVAGRPVAWRRLRRV